jgi:hypothetical protein
MLIIGFTSNFTAAWVTMPSNCHLSQTTKQHYRVDRREIAFIRFILEAYEGLAILKTLNSEAGLVEFQIAPGCEGDLKMLLRDLEQYIMMEAVQMDGVEGEEKR